MKIALVCIVKKENKYLLEYINYYKKLGVDQIFIYDNNDIEGEFPEEVISNIENVEIINFRGQKNCQVKAYNECINKYKNFYDWFIVVDADEFLYLENNVPLKKFLQDPKFDSFDAILFNWKNYGDNGLLGNEDNNNRECLKRFKIPNDYSKIIKNHVKSIIRPLKCGKFINPHCPSSGKCCSPSGSPLDNRKTQKIDFTFGYIKHFRKTIIEFLEHKFDRGWADKCKVPLNNFDWFYDYSEHNKDKSEIENIFLKTKKIPYDYKK